MMKFISLKTKIRQHLNPVQYSHIRPAVMQQDVPTGWESTGFFFSPRTITNIWYFHSPLINTIFPRKGGSSYTKQDLFGFKFAEAEKKKRAQHEPKNNQIKTQMENLLILSVRNYTSVWQLILNDPAQVGKVRYDMQLNQTSLNQSLQLIASWAPASKRWLEDLEVRGLSRF